MTVCLSRVVSAHVAVSKLCRFQYLNSFRYLGPILESSWCASIPHLGSPNRDVSVESFKFLYTTVTTKMVRPSSTCGANPDRPKRSVLLWLCPNRRHLGSTYECNRNCWLAVKMYSVGGEFTEPQKSATRAKVVTSRVCLSLPHAIATHSVSYSLQIAKMWRHSSCIWCQYKEMIWLETYFHRLSRPFSSCFFFVFLFFLFIFFFATWAGKR